MDIKRNILISAVLAAIMLQGATVASIIGPSSYGSTTQNSHNGDGTPVNQFQNHLFGSKVADGDSDIGRMLYDFDLQPVIAYWDVGLIKGEFDAADVVYIHINKNTNFTELDDIRLTKYGHHLPGSKVAADDNDINKHLFEGFPPESRIVFIDQYGSKGYDLLDPVYFHINNSLPQIGRMDLRLSYFANGPAGTLVDGHDPDRGLPATNLHYKLRFYNLNGNIRFDGKPLYDEPDLAYLDVSTNLGEPAEETYGFVVVNDVRLS
ncbi:MAG: hypothetical protein NTU95_09275 [Methanothrix sp.]|nr:hypothetical protein [Methanothrix sp.]